MPSQRLELFALNATTPEYTAIHGTATMSAVAEATASFRRGIDLSASFEFEAALSGDVGRQAHASLQAGASARAGIGLRAGVPLDLFSDAGFVALFRAQAEAAAFVRARVGLALEEFEGLIADALPAGPVRELLPVVLSEFAVEAGVWARASFSAQVLGEVALLGTLRPDAPGGAGFTARARYAVGWAAGAGVDLIANFGIADPHRLLDRLAQAIAAIVVREARRAADRLPAPGDAALLAAAPVLEIVLPLSLRTAMRLGLDLATAPSAAAREQAMRSVAGTLVELGQQQLLQALVKLGLEQLANRFALQDVLAGALAMDDAARGEALAALRALLDSLLALDEPQQDLAGWVAAVNRCVLALEPALESLAPALPADFLAGARHSVAVMWAAGGLLARVLEWRANPAAAAGDLFGATPLSAVPAANAATVNAALGHASGTALTFKDLVDFIVGGDVEAAVRRLVPGVGPVLDFLGNALATPAGGIVRHLLVDLARPEADFAQAVFATLGTGVSQAICDLVPRVIAPIKTANPGNAVLAAFLDEMVVPTLVALPVVVLPRVPLLHIEDECLHLREALSAVVLQSIGRFVLTCADVLIARGLRDGALALRALGDSLQRDAASAAEIGAVTGAAAAAPLPILLTPAEASAIVWVAADIMDRWNGKGRGAVVDAVRAVLEMGLSSDAARSARLAAILDSDAPPAPQALQAALDRTCDGLWDIVNYAVPKLTEILVAYLRRQVEALAVALHEGVKTVVAAALAAVQWMGEQLAQLRQRLAQLAQDIAQRAARLLGDVRALTAQLRARVAQAVQAVRDQGLRLVEPLLAGMPDWAADGLRALFHGLFDAVGWLATLPLQILESVAGWVEEAITARLESAGNDEQYVHDTVRARIHSAIGVDLHFDLALSIAGQKIFDLGRVTLPSGDIAGAIAGVVLGDAVYRQTVRTAAARSVELQGVRAQEATTRQAYQQSLNQQAASAQAAQAVPGRPLVANIATPAAGSVAAGVAVVNIRVEGANDTFVRPVLGIPARVVLRVNGHEVAAPATAWRQTPTGIALTLKVRAPGRVPGGAVAAAAPLLRAAAVPVPVPAASAVVLTRVLGKVASVHGARGIRVLPATPALASPAGGAAAHPVRALKLATPGQRHAPAARALRAAGAGAAAAATGTGADVIAEGASRTDGTMKPVPAARPSALLQKLATARDFTELPQVKSAPVESAVAAASEPDGAVCIDGLLGPNSVELTAADGAGLKTSSSRVFFLSAGAPAATPVGTMRAGDVLLPDHAVQCPSGKYVLFFQGDGNLVLYRRGMLALWSSGTGARGGRAVFEADGSLVVYTADNRTAWSSTGGRPGSRLVVQDDGNVVVYAPDGQPVWFTGTWERGVTYGAVVKLRHRLTSVSLHSHTARYGHPGTSGQQQVTGFAGADDNDWWRIGGPHGQADNYRAGQAVANGDIVRFTHVATGRNLHSHAGIPSPVTRQQEVTAFGEKGRGDTNDNWRVELADSTGWSSSDPLRLVHVATNQALHSHPGYSHPQWTSGQQEVTAFGGRDDNDLWHVFQFR